MPESEYEADPDTDETDDEPIPYPRAGSPGSHRRSPLGLIFLTVFLDLVGFGIVLPLLPAFARDFHASDAVIGLLMAMYSLMQFFFAPVWGRLSDRIGRRPVLLISISGSAISYLIFAFAPNLAVLFVSRIFAGVMAANISTAQAYIADVTAPEDRAKGMGMVGAAFGLGFIFGPAIGGVLAAHTANPLLAVGLTAAGFSLFDLLLAAAILPESLAPELRGRADAAPGTRIGRMVEALRHPSIGLPIGLFFISTVAWSQLEPTLMLFGTEHVRRGAHDPRMLDPAQVSYLLAYTGFIAALVQGGFAGRMARRSGEGRMILIGTLLLAIGLALVPAVSTLGGALAVLALLAVGQAMNNPAIQSLVSRSTAADAQGSTLGVSQGFSSLARAVGPFVGSVLYGVRFAYPFWMGAALMVGGFLLAGRIAAMVRRTPGLSTRTAP